MENAKNMEENDQLIKEVKTINLENISNDIFMTELYPQRLPLVLQNADIGPCTEIWNEEYLIDKVRSKEIRVHVSFIPQLDFINKNFSYKTMMFDELIRKIFTPDSSELSSQKEYYYLRSLGANPRKDVADVFKDFPWVADDLNVPQLFPSSQIFSSVFRVASPKLQLWTHYDIMDNILIQIKGKKKVVLFSPQDVPYLYLVGDKSSVLDIDNPDINKYPEFLKATKYECHLHPGDILFIPALWFHNVTSLDPGIAVNIFWRHLDDNLYDKKDTYGNKDLLPATHAMQLVDRAMKVLSTLPQEYKEFYLHRLVNKLQQNIS